MIILKENAINNMIILNNSKYHYTAKENQIHYWQSFYQSGTRIDFKVF